MCVPRVLSFHEVSQEIGGLRGPYRVLSAPFGENKPKEGVDSTHCLPFRQMLQLSEGRMSHSQGLKILR